VTDFLTSDNLCFVWYLVLGVLLAGYAVLDGFDLGVGILHPFAARSEEERRASLNSIGPVWDGNEVWLVTFGGAMFAMFPGAYAALFSGFYLAFMLLLFALILRAVSIEFRGKRENRRWKIFWDYAFSTASFLAALLFGVAVGNVMRGIRVDENGNFLEGLLSQLHPYALLVGLLVVAAFAMHGALYLYLKSEAPLRDRLITVIWRTFGLFLVLYLCTTIATLAFYPRAAANFDRHPWLWVLPLLHVLAVANIPRAVYFQRPAYAFASSSFNLVALTALLGAALYPNFVRDPVIPAHSITMISAASSALTLKIGLLIVALGMPFVLVYTAIIYRTFWGKVKIGPHSY
jgi:cytochrome bd ubiquinol oxidase subunit II